VYDDELLSVKLYDDELVFGLLNSPLWKLYDDKFIALFSNLGSFLIEFLSFARFFVNLFYNGFPFSCAFWVIGPAPWGFVR
jgi:hypothetical protein